MSNKIIFIDRESDKIAVNSKYIVEIVKSNYAGWSTIVMINGSKHEIHLDIDKLLDGIKKIIVE